MDSTFLGLLDSQLSPEQAVASSHEINSLLQGFIPWSVAKVPLAWMTHAPTVLIPDPRSVLGKHIQTRDIDGHSTITTSAIPFARQNLSLYTQHLGGHSQAPIDVDLIPEELIPTPQPQQAKLVQQWRQYPSLNTSYYSDSPLTPPSTYASSISWMSETSTPRTPESSLPDLTIRVQAEEERPPISLWLGHVNAATASSSAAISQPAKARGTIVRTEVNGAPVKGVGARYSWYTKDAHENALATIRNPRIPEVTPLEKKKKSAQKKNSARQSTPTAKRARTLKGSPSSVKKVKKRGKEGQAISNLQTEGDQLSIAAHDGTKSSVTSIPVPSQTQASMSHLTTAPPCIFNGLALPHRPSFREGLTLPSLPSNLTLPLAGPAEATNALPQTTREFQRMPSEPLGDSDDLFGEDSEEEGDEIKVTQKSSSKRSREDNKDDYSSEVSKKARMV